MHSTIENSFGRLLSPIEIETIDKWLVKYSVAEIREALKLAIDANVYNLRYIEVVLNNWRMNGERRIPKRSMNAPHDLRTSDDLYDGGKLDKQQELIRKLYSS